MPIITADDLSLYLRDPSVATAPGVDLIVDLANGVVGDARGAAAITSRVRAITLEVAARAYRNPNGYSSETVDDYTYRRDAETRQAGVYLTASEYAEVSGSSAVRGAYSVDLGTPVTSALWW